MNMPWFSDKPNGGWTSPTRVGVWSVLRPKSVRMIRSHGLLGKRQKTIQTMSVSSVKSDLTEYLCKDIPISL